MARMPDLGRFVKHHGLRLLSIADLIEYRLQQESLVEKQASSTFTPTLPGLSAAFRVYVYNTPVERTEYLALVLGEVGGDEPVLVRVQTACFPGDVFGSAACDCGAQLRAALQAIERAGRGVFLYVYPAGRQSLLQDVRAHVMHEEPARSTGREHKLRDFGLGAQVLADLGVTNLRLLTNNPKKIAGLEGFGMCVVERVPIEIPPTLHNVTYLRDKRDREGHLLSGEANVSLDSAAKPGDRKGET
jgi:3,4-dihydroxy 2-butanone 4-phosphate synthase/GTP cyclohydrolase II